LFVQIDDVEGRTAALNEICMVLKLLDRPYEAIENVKLAIGLVDVEQTNPARQLIADITAAALQRGLAAAYERIGEDALAEAAHLAAIEVAERSGVPKHQGESALIFSRFLHRLGRVDEAVAMLRRSRAKFREQNVDQKIAEVDGLLAEWTAATPPRTAAEPSHTRSPDTNSR
jgi:hypothetical protein